MANKNLKNKKLIVGVTSGIAIYKICSLVRLFLRNEARVKVVMTENATKLISPLVFQALIRSPVYVSMFESVKPITAESLKHISLSEWADIFILAPATAATIGKIANGIADNLLVTTILALPQTTPLIVAPAMDENMWENVFVQENIKKLKKRKNLKIIIPKEGLLASGKKGRGRMAEPKEIFKVVKNLL